MLTLGPLDVFLHTRPTGGWGSIGPPYVFSISITGCVSLMYAEVCQFSIQICT